MKWRWPWPWQWPEAAPVLDAMADDTADEAGDCGCQPLIDRLERENDLLHDDLARVTRTAKDQAERDAERIASLTRRIRESTPFGEREELLRLQETNERLMQRINLMTEGAVTL